MLLSTLVLAAAEGAEHHEKAVNEWIVGGIALAVLLGLLLALLAFAGGRDHS